MLENVQPAGSTPAPQPPISTPPGTTGGATPTPWRAPANAPAWAAGKSAEEILNIADALVTSGAAREPAPQPATPAATEFGFADDEYISGAQLKQQLARITAGSGGAVDLAASGNLAIARQMFASDFAKYGAEIERTLQGVPKGQWNLDNLATVVKMVRADHIDEIAHERAQQLVSTMEPTLRSGGAAAPLAPVNKDHSLDADYIPAEWKERAKAAKITPEIVRDFCRANDMTEAQFYEQFKTPMNRIVEDISQRRTA